MKYKTIYSFSVMDEIEKGNTVYCLDRGTKSVTIINDVCVEAALFLLRDAKEDTTERFEFWKVDNNG
jgi:hypothetical protein